MLAVNAGFLVSGLFSSGDAVRACTGHDSVKSKRYVTKGSAKEWRDKSRIPPIHAYKLMGFWCSDELRRELRQAQELPRSTVNWSENWSEHSARVIQHRFIIRPESPVSGAKPQIFKGRAALDLSFE
jgi:hypothetical protein